MLFLKKKLFLRIYFSLAFLIANQDYLDFKTLSLRNIRKNEKEGETKICINPCVHMCPFTSESLEIKLEKFMARMVKLKMYKLFMEKMK